MTYEKLFDLKFKKGLSTYELIRKFPESVTQVSEIALLEVPKETLQEIIKEEKDFNRIMRLKQMFSIVF